MHSNVTIKNVSWPHFSWPTLYVVLDVSTAERTRRCCYQVAANRRCFRVSMSTVVMATVHIFLQPIPFQRDRHLCVLVQNLLCIVCLQYLVVEWAAASEVATRGGPPRVTPSRG